MKHTFSHNNTVYELELSTTPTGLRVQYQGQSHDLTLNNSDPGEVRLTLDGHTLTLHTATNRDKRWVALAGQTYELRVESAASQRVGSGQAASEGTLRAPMPGQVRAVNARAGDVVAKGDTIIILEAMKMEIKIQAPIAGTLEKITVAEGDQVDKEQALAEIT